VLPENHKNNKASLMDDLFLERNNLKKHIPVKQNTKTNHMNKLLLAFVFLAGFARTQTVIEFDNMETSSTTYLSAGWLFGATSGWFTNASVSPSTSAAILGVGNGSSGIEQDWYSLPTVTLDPTKMYELRFRVASYTYSSASATRGLDAADYLSVQVSANGGTYVNEMRITGNSNATWPYTNTGVVIHTANGTFTNSAAPTGDVYQAAAGASTATPATYTLMLASNLTSVAVDFYCRVNSAGEEWWLDNIELIQIDPLPVEMMSFEGLPTQSGNLLAWKTASEHNSDYYWIERTTTSEFTEKSVIGLEPAVGNSTMVSSYTFIDNDFEPTMNYYRLVQVDKDGKFKIYGPILVDNTADKYVVKLINMMGQEVSAGSLNTMHGIYFEVYNDGTMKKVYK